MSALLPFCVIGGGSANDLLHITGRRDYRWGMPGGTAPEMGHVLIFSRSLLARRIRKSTAGSPGNTGQTHSRPGIEAGRVATGPLCAAALSRAGEQGVEEVSSGLLPHRRVGMSFR